MEIFNLPIECKIDKNIPKEVIYKNAEANDKLKRVFIDTVEKIRFMYLLNFSNSNIQSYISDNEKFEEIDFIKIILKEKGKENIISKLFHQLIPKSTVIILEFKNEILISASNKKVDKERIILEEVFNSTWIDVENKMLKELEYKKLNSTNLKLFYEDITEKVRVINLSKKLNCENSIESENIDLLEKLNTEKTENESYLEEVRNSLSEEDDEYRILNDNNDAFVKTAVEVELKVALNRINTKEIGVLNEYLNLISETKQKKIKLDFIEKNKEKVEWEKIELSKDGTASKKKVESRIKEIREAIVFEKDSFEEKLKNILEKLSKNIEIDKQIKEIETKQKEKVLEKIKNLTDDEIDKLVYNKWFYQLPDMVEQLVYAPLKKELKILEELEERYSETLDILDKELSILEKSLEEMLKNLVVTTNE